MTQFEVLADGLGFPEGPVIMPDGSILVTEISKGRLTRVTIDGHKEVFADTGGGPNGAAIGSDGQIYACNNGGFSWHEDDTSLRPKARAANNAGGSIQRVDAKSGAVEILYTSCDGVQLRAPNDLIHDGKGGFWFTDHGHRADRTVDFGAVYYAREDGSYIREAAFPLIGPNGIGLSPDGTFVYVAETSTGRLWQYKIIGEGIFAPAEWLSPTGGDLLSALPGFQRYDSLAVEECGNIAVATLRLGGINVVSSAGQLIERIELPDPYTTNIAFGGKDMCQAYITLSSTGQLVRMPWARPGLKL